LPTTTVDGVVTVVGVETVVVVVDDAVGGGGGGAETTWESGSVSQPARKKQREPQQARRVVNGRAARAAGVRDGVPLYEELMGRHYPIGGGPSMGC
jgi:hypothetical protein